MTKIWAKSRNFRYGSYEDFLGKKRQKTSGPYRVKSYLHSCNVQSSYEWQYNYYMGQINFRRFTVYRQSKQTSGDLQYPSKANKLQSIYNIQAS